MRGLGRFRGLKRRHGLPAAVPVLVWSDDTIIDGWTIESGGVTLAAAGENDPEAAVVAVSMRETAQTSVHRVFRAIPDFTNGLTYRIRVVVKGDGRPAVALLMSDGTTKYWYGVLGSATPMLSAGMSGALVSDLGGGWYAHSVDLTITGTTGSKTVFVGISLEPANTNYAGDITKGLVFGSVKIYEVA